MKQLEANPPLNHIHPLAITKVCGCYVLTYLHHTSIVDWCVVKICSVRLIEQTS